MAVTTESLEITLLHPAATPPSRSRSGDVGYDLCCLAPFQLWPGQRATVATGVAVAVPEGVAGLVVPRSGLASRHGVTVLNGPGLIDPNYRGEIKVVLVNHGNDPYRGEAGDRIAQLLLVPCLTPEVTIVDRLQPAGDDRGVNGFGSSGR